MSLNVIVPVMRRPHNAEPFMTSLVGSDAIGDLQRVWAVCDEDDIDTISAWGRNGATILISRYGPSFPDKAQYAYEEVIPAEWIFLCGDDVRFKADWWSKAMHVAKFWPEACLIATNDTKNPFVLSGRHATHPIIRTSWIDSSGASWDGPGTIVHRGYHHQWCDNEWSEKASMEGVFASALDSVVWHLHPTWSTGPFDEVYALGLEHGQADADLFVRRRDAAMARQP